MTLPSLDPVDLAALEQASTATLTTQLFERGLRNQHVQGVSRVTHGTPNMVGEAFTLRYIPAREDLDVIEVFQDPEHPQRVAIEAAGPGRVLVMDCRGDLGAASAGNILLTRLQRTGAAGVVTDGMLRDSHGISELAMPVYAAGASPMTNLGRHHAVDLQVPVACGGVAVFPGDVLVGDDEGVVCVPRHLVPEIAQPAAEQERLEAFILAKVEAGAPLRGTYPPDARTIAEYRAGAGASGAAPDGRGAAEVPAAGSDGDGGRNGRLRSVDPARDAGTEGGEGVRS